MPLNTKIGGQVKFNSSGNDKYLTEEQARYVYKKIESGSIINTDTLWQEIEQEQELSRKDNTSRDANPYGELIDNNTEKIETVLAQMEHWSILSNVINYTQYDKYPKNYHSFSISVVNKEKNREKLHRREKAMLELDFGHTPGKLKEEYLDVYEGIQSEVLSTTRFDENSDLSNTYLGKVGRSKNDQIKAEESFPVSELGYTTGRLLDGTECQVLLDMGAKSFMSKHIIYAENHQSLH